MADESCAFPGESGESSRDPGRWLDSATAERLLDGVPFEDLGLGAAATLDTRAADEAAHLARMLRALRALGAPGPVTDVSGSAAEAGSAPVWSAGAGSALTGVRPGGLDAASRELAGEAAALAAFRQARDDLWTDGEPSARDTHDMPGIPGTRSRTRSTHNGTRPAAAANMPAAPVEIGAVRLGGPGDGGRPDGAGRTGATRADGAPRRPMRFGLVAVIAACTLGGVTVAAATTGVLPSPFDDHRPSPTVSVPVGSPGPPRLSPSPGVSGDTTGTRRPSGSPDQDDQDDQDGGTDRGGSPDSHRHDGSNSSENWLSRMTSACKDYRGGRDLDAATERELEDAAHGSGQVGSFCASVLRENDSDDPGAQNAPEASHQATENSGTTSENGDGNAEDEGGRGNGNGNGGGQGARSESGEVDGEGDLDGQPQTAASEITSLPSATTTTPAASVTPEIDSGVTFSEPPTQ